MDIRDSFSEDRARFVPSAPAALEPRERGLIEARYTWLCSSRFDCDALLLWSHTSSKSGPIAILILVLVLLVDVRPSICACTSEDVAADDAVLSIEITS